MKAEIKNKEQNFVSAVVYVDKVDSNTLDFFETLNACLNQHFMQYELIAVNSAEASHENAALRDWAKGIDKPLTMIQMSLRQPHEQCMNAGLDISIGDYVYEFDSTDMPYDAGLIWEAYQTAMKGNDIVSVCPTQEKISSRLFYRIFNAHSNAEYKLRTDSFRLVSRRAINRAHAISENLPYRKATYASCGLRMAELEFSGKIPAKKNDRLGLAVDSLTLYTDFGYKFSIGLTLCMFALTVLEFIYTLAIWIAGNPISGWTTTMFVLTLGLAGLFAISALAMKYLTLIVKLNFRKQDYMIENVEKL